MERSPQITTRDTQRLRLIRGGYSPAHEHCERCGREAQMLTLAEAAAFARAEHADIEARVLAGELHAGTSAGGQARVCLNSLLSSEA